MSYKNYYGSTTHQDDLAHVPLDDDVQTKLDKQDDMLRDIHSHVVDIKQTAQGIHGELDRQGQQLDVIALKVDDVDDNVKGARKKLGAIMRSMNKSNWTCCGIIVVLVFIIIGLGIWISELLKRPGA